MIRTRVIIFFFTLCITPISCFISSHRTLFSILSNTPTHENIPSIVNNDDRRLRKSFQEIQIALNSNKSLEVKEDEVKRSLSYFGKIGKKVISMIVSLIILFSVMLQSSLAIESGGRLGGSFGSSIQKEKSYSIQRSSSSLRSYEYSYSRKTVMVNSGSSGVMFARRPSLFDVVFLGIFATVLYSFIKPTSGGSTLATTTSTLGPGTSVLQVSVALNVPKRDSSDSILSILDSLAATAKTDSRSGLQDLLSEVAVELLRQKQYIFAASSCYSHFNDDIQAQRHFNSLTTTERSKFQTETINKYKGIDYSLKENNNNTLQSLQATVAVVTLIVSIQGDSTKINNIQSFQDVQKALTTISSDALVDDCLQSAEILWTPTRRSETLSQEQIFADYPSIVTI